MTLDAGLWTLENSDFQKHSLSSRISKVQHPKSTITMPSRSLLLVASCLLLLLACDDDNEKTRASLLGRWELAKGFRNQKETETLQGVFFQFGADGKMTTNLPVGADAPTEYDLKQNEILQKSPQAVTYCIQSMTDSPLVLTMEMRGMLFEMQRQRAVLPTEPAVQDSLSQPADSLSE